MNMTMKCLREFYHKIQHHELDVEDAFLAVEKVLREAYDIIHFSIFFNDRELGCLTSLYSSRDGIYAAGDRLAVVNQHWFDTVLMNGQIFTTNNKLDIYDSFVKGFDFLALGAESLIGVPITHQYRVLGVVNLTFPYDHVLKSEVGKMTEILATMKPYIFEAKVKYKQTMPGARVKLASL